MTSFLVLQVKRTTATIIKKNLHKKIRYKIQQIMTIDEKKQYEESNIAVVVTAVPEPGMITAVGVKEDGIPAAVGPPIPPGHARFYCEKCRSVSCCCALYIYHCLL